VQQNNHLLHDLHRLNTLRFNHQQQKHEMEQLLQRVQSLFVFVDSNHPHITRPTKGGAHSLLGIRENVDDGYDDDFSSVRAGTAKRSNGRRQGQQRSSKGTKRRKRRSLPMAVNTHQIAQLTERERRGAQRESSPAQSQSMHRLVIDNVSRESEESRAKKESTQIAPELLGPSTSARQHPFKKTVSSHSFFSEQQQQHYRYGAVQMKMALPGTKLWTKRDSLTGKRKKTRINAIPSSAGSTPLTTPHQSRRGNLDDDYGANDMLFDEDPHHKYLEMMGRPDEEPGTDSDTESASTEPPPNGPMSGSSGAALFGATTTERNKLTDKKTVHDLFDMLQQHTLATAAGTIAAAAVAEPTERDGRTDRESGMNGMEDCNGNGNGDAHLVPILEPSDSSSDSD